MLFSNFVVCIINVASLSINRSGSEGNFHANTSKQLVQVIGIDLLGRAIIKDVRIYTDRTTGCNCASKDTVTIAGNSSSI